MPRRSARPAVIALAIVSIGAAGALAEPSPRGAKVARWTADLDRADAALREGELDRAADAYGRVLAEVPPDSGPALLRARGLDGLGDVERLRGRARAAAESYGRAVPLWEEILGPSQPRLAVTLHNLGAVLVADGRLEEASLVLERALSIWNMSPASGEHAESTRRLLARARHTKNETP